MKNSLLYIIFFFILKGAGFAAIPIILTQDNDAWQIRGEHVDYFQDNEHKYSIYDVTNDNFKDKFLSDRNEDVVSYNKAVTYWARVDVINTCKTTKHWVLELFEPKIEYLEIYIINSEGKLTLFRGGTSYGFNKKPYYHKNYIYDLPIKPGEQINLYLKIKVKRRDVMLGVVRTVQTLVGYATTEYFLLALFYGIIIAMILSNLFLFLFLRDKAYLYYVFYILGIGAYALSLDGLGFQYFWPKNPEFNEYMFPIATYCMISSALLYARRFLNTASQTPSFIDNGIIAILAMRTVIFSLWFIHPGFGFLSWVDLIPLLYLYLTGIYLWSKGFRAARFYVLAFTLFFAGFFLSVLQQLHLIKANIFTSYSFNIGVLGEMIMLSLALAERFKLLTHDKHRAQRETIKQLKEKEIIVQRSNKELEKKVLERTKALEEKNKELDSFVYRSSHDIKGPLKSIIGASSLAMMEVDNGLAINYFGHILRSSQQLDRVVDHLLSVIEIKEMNLKISNIDIQKIIHDTVSSFAITETERIKVEVVIKQSIDFYSDKDLFVSILKNMVNTAIKFKNPKCDDQFLRIEGEVNPTGVKLIFTDNGIGIDTKIQEKIFDIFQKEHSENTPDGINLYLTRIYVEKLGGIMSVNSIPGSGSCFTINIMNMESIIVASE